MKSIKTFLFVLMTAGAPLCALAEKAGSQWSNDEMCQGYTEMAEIAANEVAQAAQKFAMCTVKWQKNPDYCVEDFEYLTMQNYGAIDMARTRDKLCEQARKKQ